MAKDNKDTLLAFRVDKYEKLMYTEQAEKEEMPLSFWIRKTLKFYCRNKKDRKTRGGNYFVNAPSRPEYSYDTATLTADKLAELTSVKVTDVVNILNPVTANPATDNRIYNEASSP